MVFKKINECHHITGKKKHYPVLLNEIISIITPQYGGTFIDCTFGQGGYSKKILSYPDSKVIALVGASAKKDKTSHIVMKYLLEFGFEVIPVNPGTAGKEILGQMTYKSIKEIDKVSITTIETSPKNSPILPSKNKNNANAKIVVIIADTTGGITSKTPSIAAL